MTNKFIKAAEVAQELEVSVPYAYWTIVNKVDKQTTSFTKNSFPLDQEKDHCYGNEV